MVDGVQHPLARAHTVFCEQILRTGPGGYVAIRNMLRNRYKLPLPASDPDESYSQDQHYEAFSGFLKMLGHILAGQTPIRVDGRWCSQAQTLEGMAAFAMPDLILREDELLTALPDLARRVGHQNPPAPAPSNPDAPYTLAQIHDAALDEKVAEVYQRDFLIFGFSDWKPI